MFEKLLIANRGEIACRVIKTARRLGIETVAVYSEADAGALHVKMADEAVFLGPPPAAQSYLLIDAIVAACKATGAQAVHPGYGFLSENAAFCQALEAAGVAFVGPPPFAIEKMGDKIESKKLALDAGVSCVPGHADAIAELAEAKKVAAEIGYPVMVKAAAGGGGKGMRVAMDEAELEEGLIRAQSEARSSFGDDRVFLEKFVVEPRHIEIQVLADDHDNVVYLGERECSIQRRHQKVIEEAPSSFLDPKTRAAMGEQACQLARAVGYRSAGTVEFIVDQDKNFYFLEMNTRLQVEHPVTELVTGLDLVEEMLRVAAGQPLRFSQKDVRMDGWAVEARVYAEEPEKGFLPSIGRLKRYVEPEGEGVRVDSGVFEGGEVSMFYDPMIAKLCAHGEDREEATDRLIAAIDRYTIEGPGHNLAFCADVLAKKRFRDGALSTGFIAQEYGDRFEPRAPAAAADLACAALAMRLKQSRRAHGVSGRMRGDVGATPAHFSIEVGDAHFLATAAAADRAAQGALWRGRERIALDGEAERVVELEWTPGRAKVEASVGRNRLVFQADAITEGWRIRIGGSVVDVRVRSAVAADMAALMPKRTKVDAGLILRSPMPGLITALQVETGQKVEPGQILCVLEAMKMENALRAERRGVIEAIEVETGASVAADQVLMRFEEV